MSPATAPLTVPVTCAAPAAALPSYTLLVVPPMLAVAVKAFGVMVTGALAASKVGSA